MPYLCIPTIIVITCECVQVYRVLHYLYSNYAINTCYSLCCLTLCLHDNPHILNAVEGLAIFANKFCGYDLYMYLLNRTYTLYMLLFSFIDMHIKGLMVLDA